MKQIIKILFTLYFKQIDVFTEQSLRSLFSNFCLNKICLVQRIIVELFCKVDESNIR